SQALHWASRRVFFQAQDGIRVFHVTGVQTCALPICFKPGGSGSQRQPAAASGSQGVSAPPAPTRAAPPSGATPALLPCGPPVPEIGRASCREGVSAPAVVAFCKRDRANERATVSLQR